MTKQLNQSVNSYGVFMMTEQKENISKLKKLPTPKSQGLIFLFYMAEQYKQYKKKLACKVMKATSM